MHARPRLGLLRLGARAWGLAVGLPGEAGGNLHPGLGTPQQLSCACMLDSARCALCEVAWPVACSLCLGRPQATGRPCRNEVSCMLGQSVHSQVLRAPCVTGLRAIEPVVGGAGAANRARAAYRRGAAEAEGECRAKHPMLAYRCTAVSAQSACLSAYPARARPALSRSHRAERGEQWRER